MRKVYRSPITAQRFSSKDERNAQFYRLLSAMKSEWSGVNQRMSWANYYRLFRHLADQASQFYNDLQAIDDWSNLERALNDNLDIVYANPLAWLDTAYNRFKRVVEIEMLGGSYENISVDYDFLNLSDVELNFNGSAYVIAARIFPEKDSMLPGRNYRFSIKRFQDAMASFGIAAYDEIYEPAGEDRYGNPVNSHFALKLGFLKRDWKLLPRPTPAPGSPEYYDEHEEDDEPEVDWPEIGFHDYNDDPKDDVLASYKKLIV